MRGRRTPSPRSLAAHAYPAVTPESTPLVTAAGAIAEARREGNNARCTRWLVDIVRGYAVNTEDECARRFLEKAAEQVEYAAARLKTMEAARE